MHWFIKKYKNQLFFENLRNQITLSWFDLM
ncbi:hypothetical protein PM8797T_31800 [Gimesia maris DSM 8797]|uniref:Uncharacterized protein n=1 Tax=Gimesia maris TaxID=122 RepID=A0ABX5YM02_9PLAN|nr:hypothetical protein PM8797T_31800 [Gimesia maris DSM 8797]QDU14671.1 hypothetical protein CA11_24800 [Gimesia maris]QEG16648.1 hypothetical protein GmarT_25140 [Gimesia maris]